MVIIKKDLPTNYQAISCALHSEYERAILQQKLVIISWKNTAGKLQKKKLQPYDLLASKGEEFLLARAKDGSQQKIRLDYIVSIKNG